MLFCSSNGKLTLISGEDVLKWTSFVENHSEMSWILKIFQLKPICTLITATCNMKHVSFRCHRRSFRLSDDVTQHTNKSWERWLPEISWLWLLVSGVSSKISLFWSSPSVICCTSIVYFIHHRVPCPQGRLATTVLQFVLSFVFIAYLTKLSQVNFCFLAYRSISFTPSCSFLPIYIVYAFLFFSLLLFSLIWFSVLLCNSA